MVSVITLSMMARRPRAPPSGWWIMISALGRALRLPFAPAASKNAPMEAAMPTHTVETSHLT